MDKFIFDIQRFENFNNTVEGAVITGTNDADVISNSDADSVTIHALGGNDFITNTDSDNVYIDAGEGDNTVASSMLYTISGNNLLNFYDNSTIIAGSGNDYVSTSGGYGIDIYSGGGDDTIYSYHSYYSKVYAGDGNDSIAITRGNYQTVDAGAGNDTIIGIWRSWGIGGFANLNGGEGDDFIDVSTYTDHSYINGGTGNDTILTSGPNTSVYGGDGNDVIQNTPYTTIPSDYVYLDGGDGNDTISNSGSYSEVYGGDGDDSIEHSGSNSYIDGGSGNNVINLASSDAVNNTVTGSGNTTIYSASSNGNVYKIDGNLVISGFNVNDTILIENANNLNYSTLTSGNNLIITANSGAATLLNAANITPIINTSQISHININNSTNSTLITGTNYADTISNSGSNVTINALGGNDSITNNADSVYIDAGDGNNDIFNSGSAVTIEAGRGKSLITNTGNNVTIRGGVGYNTVSNSGGEGLVYQYVVGSALTDMLIGFSSKDTLLIYGADYITVASGVFTAVSTESGQILIDGDVPNIVEAGVSISNAIDDTLILGTEHDDTINNLANNVTIHGLEGDDVITNEADNVYLNLGNGDDIAVSSSNTDTTVIAGAGNDYVGVLNSDKQYIDAGDGNNVVLSTSNIDTTIISGAGNDYIENTGSYNQSINAGNGDNTVISSWSIDTTITGGNGDDGVVISNSYNNYVDAGDGYNAVIAAADTDTTIISGVNDDYISINGGSNYYVDAGDGDNVVLSELTTDTTIISGNGNDSISVSDSKNQSIDAGDGDDVVISASNTDTTIISGNGNDSIVISNSYNQSINAGAGNDSIVINGGYNVYIDAGKGDDSISISGGSVVVNYTNGDGNDVITGFTASDTLIINDTGKHTSVSGNDLIITTDDGSITLVGAATLDNLNINVPYETEAAGYVDALLKRTAAGYPVVAGIAFHPDEKSGDPPTNYADSETLTITSTDNLELSGVHYTPTNSNDKWVILIHGYGHDHTYLYPFATQYLDNGYNVLMIDQRAAGKSQGEYLTLGIAESKDLVLWTNKVAELNPNAKITLHGFSMGAATAMLAAANPDSTNVTSLVEDCGYTNAMALAYILQNFMNLPDALVDVMDYVAQTVTGYYIHQAAPIDSIAGATVPSMFINGTADTVVSMEMFETLYTTSGATSKEIFTVEGAGHAVSADVDSVGYYNAVFRFNAEADGEGWTTSNSHNSIYLRGTNFDDTITNSASNVTINTGAGDDTISNTGSGNVYIFNEGDGNDVITGFNANDSLMIGDGTGTYFAQTVGDNLIICVGADSITLQNAANITPNIIGFSYVNENGTLVDNPVAQYTLNGKIYYSASLAEATNNAANNSTVTVIADSTETSALNSSKGLTITFAESGLGVYNVSGGNFISADSSNAAHFSISDRVISNSNSLQISNGATSTLDGYSISATSNGYSFALNNSFTLNDITYSGAGSATFDTGGNVSLTSGAVVTGFNDTTSTTGINLASGNYTLNGVAFSTAANTAFTSSNGVIFNLSNNAVTFNSMTFSGAGSATIHSDNIYLTDGAVVSNVAAGQAFSFNGSGTFKINDKTVISLATSLSVTNIDNGLTIGDNTFIVTGDDDYTINVDADGNIASASEIDGGATIISAGGATSILTSSAGNFTFGDKTFTISGDDSVIFGISTDGAVSSIAELSGTVSGDFTTAVNINANSNAVLIEGDTRVNVIANSNGAATISGISNGASVQSAGGATVASTDEAGIFQFRSESTQNFTISGDSSVDFILENYTDSEGNATMQVDAVTNLENGTLIIDDNTAYLKINSTDYHDELSMQFDDTATFVIADSKVVSVDGIDSYINNLKNDATVHATQALTVNNVYVNVQNDGDYNVIVQDSVTSGISNINDGANISVANVSVKTADNGEFTFAGDTFTVSDVDNSVTFLTGSSGAVKNIAEFAGTLQSSAQSYAVNGAAFTTSNTDASIISAGVGISRIQNLASGDTISGSLDTTTVVMPSDGILTINEREYILSGDADGVSIRGNVISGLDNNASLAVGAAGMYTVNDTALAANIGDTIIGTAEGAAYIYNPNNVPLNTEEMTDDEIASKVGISTNYNTVETDTASAAALISSGNLNGTMALALTNSDTTTAQTADFSNSTGQKKVTLEGGDQNITFNSGGGNVANIGDDATGEKNVQLGGGGDLVIVGSTNAPVNITASASGADTIVTAGNNVQISMGNDTKIVANSGNVTLNNYNAATGAGVQLNDTADISKAIENGNISLNNGTVSFGGTTVNLGNDNSASTTINLYNNQGEKTTVAFTSSEGGSVDNSNSRESLLMVGNNNNSKSGASSLVSGSGNDTAFGGAGDYIDLGAGNNAVILNGTGGATIALSGKTTVSGFNAGFGNDGDKVKLNNSNFTANYASGDLTLGIGTRKLILSGSSSSDLATSGDDSGIINLLIEDADGNMQKTSIAQSNAVIKTVDNTEQMATGFIGDNSGVDFSENSGDIIANLNNTVSGDYVSSYDGNNLNFSGINALTGSKGNSVLYGSTDNNTLTAGTSNSSMYGGGASNDLMIGNSDTKTGKAEFFAGIGDGYDTIAGFTFTEHNNESTADKLNLIGAAVTNVNVRNGNVLMQVGDNANDVINLAGAEGKNFEITSGEVDIIAQAAEKSLSYDGIANYYEATGSKASVTIAEDSSDGAVWLDGSKGATFKGDIRKVSAGSYAGSVELAGNDANNVMSGGVGRASLWGGNYGDDTLIGGDGGNNFYYGKGNGNDVITNAKRGDVVNLFSTTLTQITDAAITTSAINLKFSNGQTLKVNGDVSEVVFRLDDGSKWTANTSTNEWSSSN